MLLRLKQLCFCILVIFGLTACDKDDKVELTADHDAINKQTEPAKVTQPTTSPETIESETPTQKPEITPPAKEDADADAAKPQTETDEPDSKTVNSDDDGDSATAETIAKTKAEAKFRIEETLSSIEDNMEDMDDETKAILQNIRERAYEMIENMDEN